MRDTPQEFAIRKGRRDLQRLGCFLANLLKVAFLVMALSFHGAWNYGDPGLGLILLSERKLATANATSFASAFGFSGCAAHIAAVFKVLRARAEVHPCKQTTRIQPRKFSSSSALCCKPN
jgi:hypothetical protein